MKTLLVVVALCFSVVGQAVYSGSGSSSGSAAYGSLQNPASPPLAYPARTDNCVTGSESGCGTGHGALTFRLRPGDPIPFGAYETGLSPAGTGTFDPDFHSYLLLVTDQQTNAAKNLTTSFNMESDGQWDAFNVDSTMLMVSTSNSAAMVFFVDPAKIHTAAAGGTACNVSGCLVKSAITTGAVESSCGNACKFLDNQGMQAFSPVPGEANVMYELAGDGLTVYRLLIDKTQNGGTGGFSRTQIANFASILPPNYVANWNGMLSMSQDGSISISLGGGAPWTGGHAYTAPDDFILPPNSPAGHNAGKRGFQAVTSGTSNASEPTWANAQNPGDTICDDGTNRVNPGGGCGAGVLTWSNIDKVSGQGPGFDLVTWEPSVGYSRLNTRLMKIYRGAGVPYPAGLAQTDDPTICGKYGYSPCAMTEYLTLHGGGSLPDGRYFSFTATGGGAGPCLVPGTCSSMASNSAYRGAYNPATSYAAHDVVYLPSDGPPYPVYSAKNATTGNPPTDTAHWNTPADSEAYTYQYIWEKRTLLIRPVTQTSGQSQAGGHSCHGYKYLYKDDMVKHLWGQPVTVCNMPDSRPIYESVPVPTGSSVSATSCTGVTAPAGISLLPSNLPSDQHCSYRNTDTTDTPPFFMAMTDVPSSVNGLDGADQPWYGVFVGVATGLGPDPAKTVYQFAHEYNTGSESDFSVQNNISVVSQDGQFALIGTDMMGTRGSKNYQGTWSVATTYNQFDVVKDPNPPNNYYWYSATSSSAGAALTDTTHWTLRGANQCNQLRAGFKATRSTAFNIGDAILPTTSNGSFYLYTAVGIGTGGIGTPAGTTGSSSPNWNAACGATYIGQNCPSLDGTVQWFNEGANDCRGDIMLVDLLSAH